MSREMEGKKGGPSVVFQIHYLLQNHRAFLQMSEENGQWGWMQQLPEQQRELIASSMMVRIARWSKQSPCAVLFRFLSLV